MVIKVEENGIIIGFQYEDESYYFEKNAQGDVLRIYDETGAVVSKYIYDAWGNVVDIIGDEELAKINPFRYRGYYQDNETVFFYLQSRHYDGVTGRFLNADDLSSIFLQVNYILSTNIFVYCFNNCINYMDCTGYVVTPANVIGALIGLLGGALIGNAIVDYFDLGWPWNVLVIGSTSALFTVIGWSAGPVVYAVIKPLIVKAITTGKIIFSQSQQWILKALGLGQKYIRQALRMVDAASIRFTNTAMNHMADANRYVPRNILVRCIKYGTAKLDQQGIGALCTLLITFIVMG